MKLISCYIENFGGLSGYSLDFQPGITAIHAPNGFGKTTLAEFLRAMFYGFPRKAKMLDKSKRQKYTPWGGGKFGGNLVFEHEGRRYRLERTFGATPKGDSFALIDLETGKKSSRFSEEIGLELFQLDADSFERSTYLPQLQDSGSLATAGIQAKLGDLVADTADINNFDKAVVALKNKRSRLIPYRGTGGAVAEDTNQISRIQLELDRAKAQEAELERCAAQIDAVQERLLQKRTEMDENRKRWEKASEAAASRRQYGDLLTRHNAARDQLRMLQMRYPHGIPGEQELDAARELADELASLEAAGLSEREQIQYEKLREAYNAGALDEIRIEELAEQNRQLLRQRAALESLNTPKKGNLLPLILGIVLLAVGVIMRLLDRSAAVLWGSGAALLTIGILQNRKLDRQGRAIREQIAEGETQVRQTEALLRTQLGSDDFDRAISNLRLAREQVLRWMQQEAVRDGKRTVCQEKLVSILALYGLKPDHDPRRQLQQIYDDGRAWERAAAQGEELEAQLGQLPEIPEHGADPAGLKMEGRQLSEEYSALTELLLKLRQHRADLQTQVERIPELTARLKQWQEQKTAHQHKAEILDDTVDFLTEARERLTTGYLGPIRENFDRYMTELTSGQTETVFISPDLQVQLERMGQVRELGYFSAGQTDLVMLCMRFALVDALFRDTKPFVILDDPFVNLDDQRTDEALKLLQKLGKERQIIYMTCSSGRGL